MNQKLQSTDQQIFGNLPPEFAALLKYSKKLTYEQAPNYPYMKSLLSKFIDPSKTFLYFD